MLPNPEIIGAVADAIRKHKVEHVVVDPVLISTSGASLASSAAAKAMVKELLPLATVVTPNLAEVSALLGTEAVRLIDDYYPLPRRRDHISLSFPCTDSLAAVSAAVLGRRAAVSRIRL